MTGSQALRDEPSGSGNTPRAVGLIVRQARYVHSNRAPEYFTRVAASQM
ncbi:MAG TPA: hypothetical protein VM076_14325 [Gemmatimonadaceae bacterium]|nr:hypothetical protein [Gemmatimonadaceae bacterium]